MASRGGAPGVRKLVIMTQNLLGGGCEHVICRLAGAWSRMGIEVIICTEHESEIAYPLDPRVRVVPLSSERAPSTRAIPGIYAALRRFVKRERPDMVLAMPEKVNVWAALALAFSRSPLFVSERNDPHLHPVSRLKRALRPFAYRFVRGFVFQTRDAADYFSRRIRRRSAVLPNPLDPSELPPLSFSERERTVVAAGRLAPQKNFSLLISAFSEFRKTHPDYTLTIYGEGEERSALEAYVSELRLSDCVFLPGRVAELPIRLSHAGLFALSSDHEGLPNVLIEAMAVGVPCVATDCPIGGPRTLIRDRENGLLVPVGDPHAMALALSRLADDPEEAARIGRAASSVRQAFETEMIAKEWLNYFEKQI